MSSIYLKCGNIQITDSDSCFFLNPIGYRDSGFNNVLSRGYSVRYDKHMYDKTLLGLNAFYKATYFVDENQPADNGIYVHNPSERLNERFYTDSKYTKIERFSYAPIILNSQIHSNVYKANSTIKRRSPHDGYIPECKGMFEIYNDEKELIFSDALFPIKVKEVVSLKNPFNLYADNLSAEKRNFHFDFTPMIIPIKLPRRRKTFPAKYAIDGGFTHNGDCFGISETYTYFSIEGNQLSMGLSKTLDSNSKYVNLWSSKNITEKYGGEFVDITKVETDSILQEDILFIVAETPAFIANNKYRQSSGRGQSEDDKYPIDYLYM